MEMICEEYPDPPSPPEPKPPEPGGSFPPCAAHTRMAGLPCDPTKMQLPPGHMQCVARCLEAIPGVATYGMTVGSLVGLAGVTSVGAGSGFGAAGLVLWCHSDCSVSPCDKYRR
jgi:hypothetical protein